jgi:hypothetical protein
MLAVYLYLLATWLLAWVVFYGWGTLACRLARCDHAGATALVFNPWIGLACVIGVLQIWHFFAPVDAWACGVVFAFGLIGAVLGFRRLPLIGFAVRSYPLLAAIAGLLVLWLLNRSVAEPLHTDHGLYYLNTIRWASEYPIVPGIVNLHMRLAFNNSSSHRRPRPFGSRRERVDGGDGFADHRAGIPLRVLRYKGRTAGRVLRTCAGDDYCHRRRRWSNPLGHS